MLVFGKSKKILTKASPISRAIIIPNIKALKFFIKLFNFAFILIGLKFFWKFFDLGIFFYDVK